MANKISGSSSRQKAGVTVRVAQLNARRSKIVMDELREVATKRKIDVLAVQEPYTYQNSIPGMAGSRIITNGSKFSRLRSCSEILAATVILNGNYTVHALHTLSNTHCVCVEIITQGCSIYIVNMYMQYREPITDYLSHLDKVLRALRGRKIILCMDSNAKSTSWFSSETDSRGQALEELIAEHQLLIINTHSKSHTFETSRGKSNIDLTLTSSQLQGSINRWQVWDKVTTSDHNVIFFCYASLQEKETEKQCIQRYNLKRAEWKKFLSTLAERTRDAGITGGETANELALKLESLLQSTCEDTIPRKKRYPKAAPWWNKNLSALRKEVRRGQRIARSARGTPRQDEMAERYRKTRNEYTSRVKKAKIDSWQRFVTKEGNKDPWGVPYRIARQKYTPSSVISNAYTEDGETIKWEDSAMKLLNSLIPDDNEQNETPLQRETRSNAADPPLTEDASCFSPLEIKNAITSLKNNKAPGHDYIEPEVVKAAWGQQKPLLSCMFNVCLQEGTFPETWKIGNIRTLLKGADKDKSHPKSYRPICLLPVLGKVLEKLIANKISDVLCSNKESSARQFGFRRGMSAEDALTKMRQIIRDTDRKYAVAMMFDIAGAFDNVWWLSVLSRLKSRKCPSNIYRLLQSYLSNREATLNENSVTVRKKVTKGCPQGSILGPKLWNLVFDEILNNLEKAHMETVAYADDLLVIVTGNSRLELQRKANDVVQVLLEWCQANKLQLSETKSEMLLVKGYLDIRRPPTVKIGGHSLKMSESVKYLGIRYGTRLNITSHVRQVTEKAKTALEMVTKLAKIHWGIKYKHLKLYYNSIFVSIVTYGAAGWTDLMNVHHLRHLASAQRLALIRITKAYRTTSTEALQVLAAAAPIDLVLKEKCEAYVLRRTPLDLKELREKMEKSKQKTVDIWQRRWDESSKGRLTHSFFPSVGTRSKQLWVEPDYYTTQFLTGHGNFRQNLKKLNLVDSDLCKCGGVDTPRHMLFECPLTREDRTALRNILERNGSSWPCELEELTAQDVFGHFKMFAANVLQLKQSS